MEGDSGNDTRNGAGRAGGRGWWQDLGHQHINASARKPTGISLWEDLLLMGNVPVPMAGSGLPTISTHPRCRSHGLSIPKGDPQSIPSCPGTPPPYLSPDGLFCGEEEEETAEVVEDLESAESLLAGRAPCQKAAIGTRRWVQTPNRSPARGWGLTSPKSLQPRHPPLFLAIQR